MLTLRRAIEIDKTMKWNIHNWSLSMYDGTTIYLIFWSRISLSIFYYFQNIHYSIHQIHSSSMAHDSWFYNFFHFYSSSITVSCTFFSKDFVAHLNDNCPSIFLMDLRRPFRFYYLHYFGNYCLYLCIGFFFACVLFEGIFVCFFKYR